jgi:ArsR family transcriptional regulator
MGFTRPAGWLRPGQRKISRHLAYLRKAGLVEARREGKWMHYRICWLADEGARSILAAVLASLGKDKRMQADVARLDRACCAPKKLVALEGAPRPASLAASRES